MTRIQFLTILGVQTLLLLAFSAGIARLVPGETSYASILCALAICVSVFASLLLNTGRNRELLRMKHILNRTPVIVFRWGPGPGSPAEYVSDNIRCLGYLPEDFLSNRLSIWNLIHPADLGRMTHFVEQQMKTRPHEFASEYRVITRSGETRWVYDLTLVARNRAGAITHYEGILIDITDRKLAQESLMLEKERLAVTLQDIGEGVIATDRDGKITIANRAAVRLTSWPEEEALGSDVSRVFSIIDEASGEPLENPVMRVLACGSAPLLTHSGVLVARDGTRHCVASSVTPIRDSENGVAGAIVVFRDVTLDRQRELALRTSEERFRLLAENASDVVCLIRLIPEFGVEYISPSCLKIAGYPPDEFYDNPRLLLQIVHPEDADELKKAALSGVSTAEPWPVLFRVMRRDGQVLWLEARFAPLLDESGRPQSVQGIMRDVTERKQMEDRVRMMAMHDALTGVYNRARFEEELNGLELKGQYPVCIMCTDVNGLKLTNDTLGHNKGDEMLRAYASLLRRVFRDTDVIARTGGDEFAVIMPSTDLALAEKLAQCLDEAVTQHNESSPGNPVNISVGLACATGPGISLEDLLSKADRNMYRDKVHRARSQAYGVVNTLLAALSAKDYVLEGHIARVFDLSTRLGERLGLSKKDLADLSLLAKVHDLGKVGVPDSVLFKEGLLTDDEREQVQLHSVIGYRIARSAPELSHVADLILHHHEWYDGNGYPGGLLGEDIPIACRVIAIVDAYEVMTHGRPYRSPLTSEAAVAELLRRSGTQFDPALVTEFISMLLEQAS